MQAKVNGLLICDEQELHDELCRLFDFVGFSTLATRSNSWQRHVQELPEPESLSCAFVVAGEDEKQTAQLVEQLGQWQTCLPVVVLGEQPQSWSYDLLEKILCFLPVQLRYPDLLSSLHKAQIHREVFARKSSSKHLFASMVGVSESTQQVRRMMQQVAHTDANVLILGESGTGKEVVARNLHE